jgi:Ca2+-binding RTX toxin-like protein
MTLSLGDFVGFSNIVYSKLPSKDSLLDINGTAYIVKDVSDTPNNYQGMYLYDPASNTVVVVNRGTKEGADAFTDAEMAVANVNNQWPDALKLAQEASDFAKARGATVYTVGHSLGGTLTQLQAATFGWMGVTFNAYGAGEVASSLNLSIGSANITNYRTMFDVVSDVSTQIGSQPIVLETAADKAFITGQSGAPNIISLIIGDHSISNFWNSSDNTDTGVYTPAYNNLVNPNSPESSNLVATEEMLVRSVVDVIAEDIGVKSGNLNFVQDVKNLMSDEQSGAFNGIQAVMPTQSNLLVKALNPSSQDNVYRLSLVALSPVVLQGIDASAAAAYSLWSPGATAGLTTDYIYARNQMVEAEVAMAAASQLVGGSINTSDDNTYIYSDLATSSSPLYTLKGTGGITYNAVFGDDASDKITGLGGNAYNELFGGQGNDTLIGGAADNTLEGGSGDDTYIIDGGGVGADSVLDTDGHGELLWSSGGSQQTLGGGVQIGAHTWESSDEKFFYTEIKNDDGTINLDITSTYFHKSAVVEDFSNGELGISLTTGTAATFPAGTSNLSLLDSTLPGGNFEAWYYGDDGKNGTQIVDKIFGSNTTGGTGNFIDGFQNASFIYAGDGDNTVDGSNGIYDASTGGYDNGTVSSITIEGGAGNQSIHGLLDGNETIIGGNSTVGSYQTDIFGVEVGTNDLSLGTEDGFLFGGTGSSTLNAGAAQYQNVNNTGSVDAVLFAGLLLKDVGGNPSISIPGGQADNNFQVYVNGTGLLGSSLDSGITGNSSQPGSLMIGGVGNDDLIGNVGNDTLIGGTPSVVSSWKPWYSSAQSTAVAESDEVLLGGAGSNLIFAGDGVDNIYADMSPVVSNWADLDSSDSDTVYGGSGQDIVFGSGGNDYFYAGSGDFEVEVGNGKSSVYGSTGSLQVIGGSGGDYIEGGSGENELEGGSGSDTIFGGTGQSTIFGLGGNDYISGGGGNDLIFANTSPGTNGSWASVGAGDSVTIVGGGGNDTIYGSGGSNLIVLDGGSNLVDLGNGNTTVDATYSSNDTVYSGTGNQTFLFSDGGEQAYVVNANTASSNVMDMKGLTRDDVSFSSAGNDLIISFGSSNVTVLNYLGGGSSNLVLDFSDGTSMGAATIQAALQLPLGGDISWGTSGAPDTVVAGYGNDSIIAVSTNDVLEGGVGHDTIYGGSGFDVIEAGSGGASIVGGTGSETYVFNAGDGSEVITENQTTVGSDTLEFGANVSKADISFTQQGNNLIALVDGGAAGSVEIVNYFAPSSSSVHTVGNVLFSDGTNLNQAAVTAALVYHDATITGTGGSNVYRFDVFSGANTIAQANAASTNAIDFTDSIVSSDIIARRDMSNDLVLTDTLDGVSVTVDNYFTANNGGIDTNFTVNFSDGGSWNAQQILTATMTPSGGLDTLWGSDGNDSVTAGPGNTLIIATTGSNTLTGGAGADTIDGGSGTDTIEAGTGTAQINGGTGSETYVYNLGDGSSTITESTLSSGQDSLVMGAGIALANLSFSEVGNQALVIGITDPNTGAKQSVTIDNFFGLAPGSNHTIASLKLADGSTLSASDIESHISTYYGNGDNQYITGNTSNGSYYAGDGNNVTVQGGPGSDLVVGGAGTDTLFGGNGNNTIDAGSGSDLIQGGSGNDLINLGMGNATVIASDGNDTYDWNGTGNQVIEWYGAHYDQSTGSLVYNTKQSLDYSLNPNDGSGTKTGQDLLHIGNGITANELTYQLSSQNGSAVKIGIAGTTASLTLGDISTADSDGLYGLTGIQLDDGETISGSQILQYAVEASESQNQSLIWLPGGISFSEQGSGDTLNADDGNDTIALTHGSQTINVAGTNTVVFGRGSGSDTIYGLNSHNDENLNGQLTVQLAQGVRPQDIRITVERDPSGNDPAYYLISIQGSSDQLTVAAGAVGSGSGQENLILQFADGTMWNAAQIQAHASQPLDQGNVISFGYGSGDETLVYYGGSTTGVEFGSVVQMQGGIKPSDVTVTYQGNNQFALSLPGGADELIVAPSRFSYVQFADGTKWQIADIEKLALQPQAAGNQYIADLTGSNNVLTAEGNGDTLQGGSGSDTLDPGTGNTVMVAGTGNTTFLYNLGDGNDTIQSAGNIPNGILKLGTGVSESDVSVSESASGTDLILKVLSTGQTLDLQNYLAGYSGTYGTGYQPSTSLQIEFADGTVIGGAQASTSSMSDSLGGQILLGNSSSETITSSAGHDTIFGGAGAETISAGAGHDVIYQGAGTELIQAGSGSDTIHESVNTSVTESVTIDGGAGGNLIYGDGGGVTSTTLLFGQGSGQDTLYDVRNPTIQFGQGISKSNLSVQEFYVNDMPVAQLISIIGTSDSIYLTDSSATLAFSDGSTVSSNDLAKNVFVQPSTTTLSSYTYEPLSSSDPAAGFGSEEIASYDRNGFTLTFGIDASGNPITSTNITVEESGANIKIGGVTLDNFYQLTTEPDGSYGYTPANVTVQFADGVSWNTMQIQQALLAQADGIKADAMWLTQYGGQTYAQTASSSSIQYLQEENEGSNVITSEGTSGALGVTLSGTASHDTIDWGGGTNHATTVQGFSSTDVVKFDGLVLPGNLMGMAVNGTNLELYDASSGNTLVLDGYFNQSAGTNEGGTFEFADGLTVTNTQLEALLSASSTYVPVISAYLPITTTGSSTTGTQGNDTIVAGQGSETISGGGGNDQLYAGSGADTFVFGHGSGHDTIHGSAPSGVVNTLQFSADVAPSDVSVYRTGSNGTLVLVLKDSGETVTLPDYLAQSANQVIQQVTFADGTTWSVSTLASLATQPSPYNQYIQASAADSSIAAGAGNDTLVSSGGSDTLTAGGGADTLYGGAGTDLLVAGSGSASLIGGSGAETYQFAPGFGSDTVVVDNAVSNTIQFTGGTVAADVSVSTTGKNLILNVQGGGSIVLPNALIWDGVSNLSIDYSDGTSTTLEALLQALPNYQVATSGNESLVANSGDDTLVADGGSDTLVATTGDDTLLAGSGNDILQAGTGNDLVVGGTGIFSFQVGTGAGKDTIEASAPTSGSNTIALTDDFADLVFSRPVVPSTTAGAGQALNIDINDVNGWTSGISLANHYQNGASTNDVGQLQFSDGSTLALTQVDQWLSEAAAQPSTSVELVGNSNQSLTIGAYTSLVVVGSGNDTLQMSATGNTSLLGGNGNDDFIAGSGNESIQAGTGQDTFAFAAGLGQDTLSANWSSASDTIAFTDNTSLADLVFSENGNDLVITVLGSTGADNKQSTITLANYFTNGTPASDAGQISFANGSTESMADLNQRLVQSGGSPVRILPGTVLTAPANGDSTLTSDNGNDTLIGSSGTGNTTMYGGTGSDLIEAGLGNNEMEGGTGKETYQFGADFGPTTIDVSPYQQYSDTIQFTDSRITANDVSFDPNYSTLFVSIPGEGLQTIVLDNHVNSYYQLNTYDISELVFSDGTTMSMQDVNLSANYNTGLSDTLQSAPATGDSTLSSDNGNDTLVGSSGPGTTTMNGGTGVDLMIAGSGANFMMGGDGIETYEFNPGFGTTTIEASSSSMYTNTIAFGTGISASDLSYSHSGNDLIIMVNESDGSTGTITLPNHPFDDGFSMVDVGDLSFADGSIVTMASIDQNLSGSTTQTIALSARSSVLATSTLSTNATADTATQSSSSTATTVATASSQSVSSSTASTVASTASTTKAATITSAPTIGDTTKVRTTLDSATVKGDVSKHFEDVSERLARDKRSSSSLALSGDASKPDSSTNSSPASTAYTTPSRDTASQQHSVLSDHVDYSIAIAPDSGKTGSGAPNDPIYGDVDDINAWGAGAMSSTSGQLAAGASPTSRTLLSPMLSSSSQGGGARLGRTANVANDMIKALSAQGSMQALHGLGANRTSQVQLQDGTLWSLSSLDHTMAALSSDANQGAVHVSKGPSAFGSADLAHAQLIEAMASFSPQASAQSGLPPMESEAYAITVAAQSH